MGSNSGDVSTNTEATALEYNNLRKDVVDEVDGHKHTGVADESYEIFRAGVAASRPAFGNNGTIYFSTDTGVVERDNGSAWVEISRQEAVMRLAQLADRAHGSLNGVGVADHHAKYTNAEAVTQALAQKLDDFTTPDDNTDLDASTTRHGLLKKLDNVVTNFLNGQGGWSAPANPPTLSNTEVLNGTLGGDSTWEDLDISAVVGSNVALVILSIINTTSVAAFAVRTNGDTDDYFVSPTEDSGAALGLSDTSFRMVLIVVTDASGVIEIISSDASDTHIIDVIAFIA